MKLKWRGLKWVGGHFQSRFARSCSKMMKVWRPVLLSFGIVSFWSVIPAAHAGLSESEAIPAIKSELAKQTSEGRFSGAVLLAKDGKPIFEAAYGYADREKKVLNTVETKFRFGSMGKMFTAVAVMQLVQAGKIKLDDPISKYLPGYPNQEVAAVTIYELLTHTGGTGDIFGREFQIHRKELRTLKDHVALYGSRGVEFKPGSEWDYSNYGFILLGRVIEAASGQSYYDYVREHIFKPAGMSSTGNQPEDRHVPGLAVGYTGPGGPGLHLIGPGPGPDGGANAGNPGLHLLPAPQPGTGGVPGLHLLPAPGAGGHPSGSPGPLRPTTGSLPYRGTSAGGGYSPVGDFLKFADALTAHKLLNAHYTELLTTGKVATRMSGVKYAFGFEDDTRGGGRCIGHGGGSPGMNGRLMIFPGSRYVIVVLSNFDPPAADNMAQFIREQLSLR
jgi:CubicO group peptidase (beta-lactamase class C family)